MNTNVRRAANTPLSDEEKQQLKVLAQMPDEAIDFSDIPERTYPAGSETALPLEERTVTLRVDAQVAAWLETEIRENPDEINRLLRRVAQRTRRDQPETPPSFRQAS